MNFISKIENKIINWYRGEYIAPSVESEGDLIFVSTGGYNQPKLAKFVGSIGRFIIAEWKWIIGILIAVIGISIKFI